MTRKTAIVSALIAAMLVSLSVCVWLTSGLLSSSSGAMSSGEPVAASFGTWATLVASFLGMPLTGGAAGLVAWLMKATPLISPKLAEGVGQHQAVLTAILGGLQIASGQPAESKGEATLNGGKLVWSFTFTPAEGVK